MQTVSPVILRFSWDWRTWLQHDSVLRDIYRKLMPLLQPPSAPPKRRIGFVQDDE